MRHQVQARNPSILQERTQGAKSNTSRSSNTSLFIPADVEWHASRKAPSRVLKSVSFMGNEQVWMCRESRVATKMCVWPLSVTQKSRSA